MPGFEPGLDFVLVPLLWVTLTILFMNHYDPKARDSRARRCLVWYIPWLALLGFLAWLSERLRTQ